MRKKWDVTRQGEVRKKNKGEIMRQLRGEKGKEDRNNEREIERYVD